MISLYDSGIYLVNSTEIVPRSESGKVRRPIGENTNQVSARKGIIVYSILEAHNTPGDMEHLRLRFDSTTSHNITFVGTIQTIRVSGVGKFSVPYVLTNHHNILCAAGGTTNEGDYMFGLSAMKKYRGIYAPLHIAVTHQYAREIMAGCSRMIFGPDSRTRYRASGTMVIGRGDGELIKQLLKDAHDVAYSGVMAVYLDGAPQSGTGPQDIVLTIIGAVFKSGYVKNKVMEFVEPGVASITTDYCNGVDVMTTETTCLSSIWRADDDMKAYLARHHREEDYKELAPAGVTYYDDCVYVDLSTIRPMTVLPFHPSSTYKIDELKVSLNDIPGMVEAEAVKASGGRASFTLRDKIQGEWLMVQQAVIVGCAGGIYSNVMEAARVLKGKNCSYDEFSLAVYPSSRPVLVDLVKRGATSDLVDTGVIIQTTFCGPCLGTGDTPYSNGLSIHHTAGNSPNRRGSKPGSDQMIAVALMDARSTAATAANRRKPTPVREVEGWGSMPRYELDGISCENRVYMGYNKGDRERGLVYGSSVRDWPEMSPLVDNILLKACSKIIDSTTITDELIPFGETSSHRSNPLSLAEFTLSRRDPKYVGRAKKVDNLEKARTRDGVAKGLELESALEKLSDAIHDIEGNESITVQDMEVGSMVYAVEPGDGSTREQAAGCQGVIGGLANICKGYTTRRYRSNTMNRGMVPFQTKEDPCFEAGGYVYIPGVREALDRDLEGIKTYVLGKKGGSIRTLDLYVANMTAGERDIVKADCLINYNRDRR